MARSSLRTIYEKQSLTTLSKFFRVQGKRTVHKTNADRDCSKAIQETMPAHLFVVGGHKWLQRDRSASNATMRTSPNSWPHVLKFPAAHEPSNNKAAKRGWRKLGRKPLETRICSDATARAVSPWEGTTSTKRLVATSRLTWASWEQSTLVWGTRNGGARAPTWPSRSRTSCSSHRWAMLRITRLRSLSSGLSLRPCARRPTSASRRNTLRGCGALWACSHKRCGANSVP